MLLNRMWVYSKFLHAYALLDHANAVLDQWGVTNQDMFLFSKLSLWIVSNRDMLLVKNGLKKYRLWFSKDLLFEAVHKQHWQLGGGRGQFFFKIDNGYY